jgi:hypothetical protein
MSDSETEFANRMWETRSTYLVAFAAGNLHERFMVLNSIPSTLPKVDSEKAFSLFGQSGASLKLHSEQSFLYFSANSLPHGMLGGQTNGVSSNWRWIQRDGKLHEDAHKHFKVLLTTSKFCTDDAEPKICLSSTKYLPSQLKPWYLNSLIFAGTFL